MAGWLQRKIRLHCAHGWRRMERWRMINFNRLSEYFFEFRKPLRLRGGTRADRGRFGEARAADFVRRDLGYRILARNWRYKRDEIDLVCLDGLVLVFIEVRLRRASAKVPAYYSVDKKRKKHCSASVKITFTDSKGALSIFALMLLHWHWPILAIMLCSIIQMCRSLAHIMYLSYEFRRQ